MRDTPRCPFDSGAPYLAEATCCYAMTKLIGSLLLIGVALIALTLVTGVERFRSSAPLAGAAGGGPDLAFSPGSSSIAVGQSENVDVTVANVSNLGGYDISITYNATVTTLDSLTDAGIFDGSSVFVFCATPTITPGHARATCDPLSAFAPGPSVGATPRALLHGSFSGRSAGSSNLSLAGSTLENPTQTPIPATMEAGSITVAGTAPAVGGIAEEPQAFAKDQGSSLKSLPLLAALCAAGLLLASGLALFIARRR